jgi:Na+/H+-dicarboxylate symporter
VDRLLDMLRTTVNVTSSLICATYIARTAAK